MSDLQPGSAPPADAAAATTADPAPVAVEAPQTATAAQEPGETTKRYVEATVAVAGLDAGQKGWVDDDTATAALVERGLLVDAQAG